MASLVAPPHPSIIFPRLLLASVDDNGPSFAGWVGSDASGEDLWLRLEPQTSDADGGGDGGDAAGDDRRGARPPPPSDLRSSRLLLSPSLQRALRGHEDAVAARLRQSRDASEFFSELKTLLDAVGVVSSGSGNGRRKRSRGGGGGGGDTGSGSGRALPSSSSSAFYSALLERLGPRAWNSMTDMREASAAAGSGGGGEVLLSFAVVPSEAEEEERRRRASSSRSLAAAAPPSSPFSLSPLRVTLALDPSTFPRSAPRVASVDLPQALLRPPLALPIAAWWNNRGGGSDRNGNAPAATATATAAGAGTKKSAIDDVLSWLLAAASSRAAAAAFAALDQLDAEAWVLDPPLPAPRARTSRRLAAAAGGRASVEVDFACFFSSSSSSIPPSSSSSSSSPVPFLPAPRFAGWLGPEALVAPLREAAAEASSRGRAWDPSEGAVRNLEALLLLTGRGEGRQLPRRPGGGAAAAAAAAPDAEREGEREGEEPVGLGDGAECAICCAYRLDDNDGDGGDDDEKCRDGGGGDGGAAAEKNTAAPPSSFSLPSVSCENERCCRPFHASCLREWLIAAAGGGGGGAGGGREGAGARDGGGGGGVLRGECPYCSEPISVSKK